MFSTNVIHYSYRFKNGNNVVILTDAKQPSTKFNSLDKKPGIQGSYLNIRKATHENSQHYSKWEKASCTSLKIRNETVSSLSTLFQSSDWSLNSSNTRESNKKDTSRKRSQVISICRCMMSYKREHNNSTQNLLEHFQHSIMIQKSMQETSSFLIDQYITNTEKNIREIIP